MPFAPKGEVSCHYFHMGLPSLPILLLLVPWAVGLQTHFPTYDLIHHHRGPKNHFTWRRFDNVYITWDPLILSKAILPQKSAWQNIGMTSEEAQPRHYLELPTGFGYSPARCGILWTSSSYMVLCLSSKNT